VTTPVRVLVVEDEPVIADAHAQYVQRVPGFAVAGIVHDGGTALRFVRDHEIDLLLLDFNLPDMHGLDVCRRLRGAGAECDVMAVTSNRDLAAVRTAVSLGVVQYLLKPFTFQTLRDKLERYAEYRAQMQASGQAAAQSEVDRAFAALRGAPAASLPTGCSEETLEVVTRHMLDAGRATSAAEVGAACHISRVTARRYLEHLTRSGLLVRKQRHRGTGRPEIEYAWRPRAG
jgi:response regulator of citrate/malate metabolism